MTPEEKANRRFLREILVDAIRFADRRTEIHGNSDSNFTKEDKLRLLDMEVRDYLNKWGPLLDKMTGGKAKLIQPHPCKPGAIPSPIVDILKP